MNEIIAKYAEKIFNPWVIIGFLGQILFFGRFVVQWIASEKQKQSVIPVAFWYFSLAGGILILIYSISIGDIVFTAGSSLNLIIYLRNLVLINKAKVASR
ncbi:MAG: lipid-A-disaccharide synthase N-terminal domain-containing protein [Bdellovibrionota bacterium]